MLEKEVNTDVQEKNELETINEDTDLDLAIDNSLLELPLNKEERKLINSIIDAPNKAELQKQFDLFNVNQSKKDALRIIKLNNLLSKVEDQAIERFEKRPDQVSNKELLEYMTVVSGQIDRAQKSINSLDTNPSITVANQKNEVNIHVGENLDRDSKEKVMDAISALLKQVKKDTLENPIKDEESTIIDAEIVEEPKDNTVDNSDVLENSEKNLYNNNVDNKIEVAPDSNLTSDNTELSDDNVSENNVSDEHISDNDEPKTNQNASNSWFERFMNVRNKKDKI